MSNKPTVITTARELNQFKKTARAGERVIYHDGFLCNDRLYDAALDNLGAVALALEAEGYVQLFQDRLGDMHYQYIAVRTAKGTEQVSAPSLALAA